MEFNKEYIRKYMDYLDEITGYNTKDIPIEISNKMTRMYGYCSYKFIEGKYKTVLFKFSESLLKCGVSKEQMDDAIRHEYCHSWADEGHTESSHHKGRFEECCKILKCTKQHENKDRDLSERFNGYVYNKKKSQKENYRLRFEVDVFEPISSMKYTVKGEKYDNNEHLIKVNYTLKDGYSNNDVNYIVNRLKYNGAISPTAITKGNKGTIIYFKK